MGLLPVQCVFCKHDNYRHTSPYSDAPVNPCQDCTCPNFEGRQFYYLVDESFSQWAHYLWKEGLKSMY